MSAFDNVVSLEDYRKRKLSPQFDDVRRSMWHPSMGDMTPEEYWAKRDAEKDEDDAK